MGKICHREFLLPRRKVVKGGAISGVLRQIGRDHVYVIIKTLMHLNQRRQDCY